MKSGGIRILIVGGNGYVGSTLARELSAEHSVFSTFQNELTPQKNITYFQLSLLQDKESCRNLTLKVDPDVIIYCAGSNDLLYCEQEQNIRPTQMVQSTGASNFLAASDSVKAKFIYLSSDYIFSGVDGNYTEEDSAIPAFQLGKAKMGAENFIRSRSLNYLIIRSAPLMGRGTLDHPSWLDKIRESVLTQKKVKLPGKSVHNPVHISFLVEIIRQAISLDLKNKTLHVGGLSKVSLFECAQIFVNQLRMDPAFIEPSDASSNAMPSDYSLNFSHTLKLIQVEPLLLEESLDLLK
jgi:dTDP-4-dehydrorhamnose reductase